MKEFLFDILSSVISATISYFTIELINKFIPKVKDFINKMMS